MEGSLWPVVMSCISLACMCECVRISRRWYVFVKLCVVVCMQCVMGAVCMVAVRAYGASPGWLWMSLRE